MHFFYSYVFVTICREIEAILNNNIHISHVENSGVFPSLHPVCLAGGTREEHTLLPFIQVQKMSQNQYEYVCF